MFVSLPLLYWFLVTFRIKAQLLSTAEMPFRFLLLPLWPTFSLVNLLSPLSRRTDFLLKTMHPGLWGKCGFLPSTWLTHHLVEGRPGLFRICSLGSVTAQAPPQTVPESALRA